MKRKKANSPARLGFVALGCPKNLVDSEVMLARLGEAGFIVGADPDNADVVVINTCGFIAPARQEALEAIRRAIRQKRRGRVGKVIVAGCLSQLWSTRLAAEVDGIDAIVSLDERDAIAAIIQRLLRTDEPSAAPEPAGRPDLAQDVGGCADDRGRLRITPRHWAYLRISEGCDRACSFCTIPSIRGPFRSKPIDQVVAEAEELARDGVVELILVAQDTASYGRDLGLRDGLVRLLRRLEAIEPLRWIRVMYLFASSVRDDLIDLMAASQKVLPYVDMPIQHANDRILERMHRPDRRETMAALIEKLRAAMPDVVLRTTVIVGFPGETDEAFAELLEFIRWARFDALGCFAYCAEPDTPAATLPDAVPEPVREDRRRDLMLAQQQIVAEKGRAMIGRELLCLIDEAHPDGTACGRYYGQAPDIDGLCLFRKGSPAVGTFVPARVIEVDGYDLVVEPIEGCIPTLDP